jgi:hypothetical protein
MYQSKKELFNKAQSQVAVGVGLTVLGSMAANATSSLDFTAVTSAIDATTIVAAIAAIAAVKILPGVAKWGFNKVIGWFK